MEASLSWSRLAVSILISLSMSDFDDAACEQDEVADLVDFEATPEEVLSRIEHCISAFLEELSCGRLQSIQTVHSMLLNIFKTVG